MGVRELAPLVLGRLRRDAIPFHEPILLWTFVAVAFGGVAVLGAVTYFRLWGVLWRDWFTSVDHKKIGIMYFVLGLVMLLRGFSDAHDASTTSRRVRWLPGISPASPLRPDLYRARRDHDLFRGHAVVTGLMNFVVPLQIGARDVAFPFLNNFSFWMTTVGAVLVMMSLFIGEFARTGWLGVSATVGDRRQS